MTDVAERMLADLPEAFRRSASSGDTLARLLNVVGAVYFEDGPGEVGLPALESRLADIPAIFRPPGGVGGASESTPDAFLPWLAEWLQFTPHPLLGRDPLRRVLAQIVPKYGLRGTRGFLTNLIELACDEPLSVEIDDHLPEGLIVGRAVIGTSSSLTRQRPLRFRVTVTLESVLEAAHVQALERRLHALIEFGKPAHTTYDLHLRTTGANMLKADKQATAGPAAIREPS